VGGACAEGVRVACLRRALGFDGLRPGEVRLLGGNCGCRGEFCGRGSDDRSADADAPVRSEGFGRMLGADWVEVEPGIYEHRPLRLTEPPETSSPPAPGALDEELLENLPRTPEAKEPTHRRRRRVPRGGGSAAEDRLDGNVGGT
jgi:hypothetical protein